VRELVIALVLALAFAVLIAVLIERAKVVAARPALKRIEASTTRIRAIGRPWPTLTLRYTLRLVLESGETIGHQSGTWVDHKPGEIITHGGRKYELIDAYHGPPGQTEGTLVLKLVQAS
jgi:hypothetical protein